MFTSNDITPHALATFEQVKKSLPDEIATRLKSSRKMSNHGSYNDLFLFDVYDKYQTDVINRYHFKYCLGYRPNDGNTDGYLHLWLSRIRIYRRREEIIHELDAQLQNATPKGFTFHPHRNRAFNIGCDFNYPSELSKLPEFLTPLYVRLISAIHPILIPIIDKFTTSLAPGERRRVVAERGLLPFTRPGVKDPERVREYSRSIPPSWKPVILEMHGYRCAICKTDLRVKGSHIDHILPFSRGGTSTRENLQPLCPSCNLKKGNR